MAEDGYVHGIVVKEGGAGVQAIRSPSQAVVGIVGTAPGSTTLPTNTPTSFLGKKAAIEAIVPKGASGKPGTLYAAVLGVYEQTPARIVLVRSASESDADILKAIDALLDAESVTGFKPKILIAPGFGNTNPVDSSTPRIATPAARSIAPNGTSVEAKNG